MTKLDCVASTLEMKKRLFMVKKRKLKDMMKRPLLARFSKLAW